MIYVCIDEQLKTRNKSKYWLIKSLGASYQSMSKLMNNETISIHFETLDKICDVLDCGPEDIIKRKKGD